LGLGPATASVSGPAAGEDPSAVDAVTGEPETSACQEPGCDLGSLVLKNLGVHDVAAVIEGYVEVAVPDPTAGAVNLPPAASNAASSSAENRDDLLDVNLDQLAWAGPAHSARRVPRLCPARLCQAERHHQSTGSTEAWKRPNRPQQRSGPLPTGGCTESPSSPRSYAGVKERAFPGNRDVFITHGHSRRAQDNTIPLGTTSPVATSSTARSQTRDLHSPSLASCTHLANTITRMTTEKR